MLDFHSSLFFSITQVRSSRSQFNFYVSLMMECIYLSHVGHTFLPSVRFRMFRDDSIETQSSVSNFILKSIKFSKHLFIHSARSEPLNVSECWTLKDDFNEADERNLSFKVSSRGFSVHTISSAGSRWEGCFYSPKHFYGQHGTIYTFI